MTTVPFSLCQPLRFQPFFRPMPWGGRGLERVLGKTLPHGEPIGESWEVSDHALHDSVIASGGPVGMTLRQLMDTARAELLGHSAKRFPRFPWLIKFLDANDNLSVQVHPNEDLVQALWPGEGAKNEAWLVLEARPGSRIYAGLRMSVGPDDLHAAMDRGTMVECLHHFEPRRGDFVALPAGTVHALGGGVLVAEIQQTSDATFRLFDWGRRDAQGQSRKLHVDEGLACIDWQQGPIYPIPTAGRESPGAACRMGLLHSPHFVVEFLHEAKDFSLGGENVLQALIVTGGHALFENDEPVVAGHAWLLPAAAPAMGVTVQSPLTGLLCTLP